VCVFVGERDEEDEIVFWYGLQGLMRLGSRRGNERKKKDERSNKRITTTRRDFSFISS